MFWTSIWAEGKGVRDVWITFESNPNLERASSQSFSLTSCQPQARIWKIVFVWPAADLPVISLVESIMLWPIWSLANCVETGRWHKVQSPFLKSSCMAVWSWPLLGRKHVLMCSRGPKSSSPSAMPRAMTLTVKQELAILGSLRVWQQLLMSFRTFMFTTRYILSLAITREGGVASFRSNPRHYWWPSESGFVIFRKSSLANLANLYCCHPRDPPNGRLPYLAVIIPHTHRP